MNRLRNLQERFVQLLDSQQFVESALDYRIVERHVKLLRQLDAINTGAISLFDLFRREHVFFSPKFGIILGWDMTRAEKEGTAYTNSRIHPDDLLLLTEAGTHFTSLVFSLSPNARRDYKMYCDYRIIGGDGQSVRVLEQQSVLESDVRGNVWLALSALDLSPYGDTETPVRCRMVNSRTRDLYLFPPPGSKEKDLLTMREKEILSLISKGLISREIADLLYISVNTVNTHRQRIIERLDVSSTSEAIRYAMELGILPAAGS
jgi:DNA-binding CsgD family transcriptional regulator